MVKDTKHEYYYNGLVFFGRRFITAVILVMLRGYSYFQIIFLAYLQTAYMIYIGLTRPMELRTQNNDEMKQEICVMLCIYHLFMFSDWLSTVSAYATYNTGWSFCAVVFLVIIQGIYRMLKQTIKGLKLKWK